MASVEDKRHRHTGISELLVRKVFLFSIFEIRQWPLPLFLLNHLKCVAQCCGFSRSKHFIYAWEHAAKDLAIAMAIQA